MQITSKEFLSTNIHWLIRSAVVQDAENLAELRLQIDGETENLDRIKGEAYIDEAGFRKMIEEDKLSGNSLFIVAEAYGKLVAFSRCEGTELKRTYHQTEFGIGVLREYWGNGVGKNLLNETIQWADANGIQKITLKVLETNHKAIALYKKFGFRVEGVLKKDKRLSDGNYYSTVLMGKFNGND